MANPISEAAGELRLPPLRIHHFMLATVTVAAVMSLYTALMQSLNSAPTAYYVLNVLGFVIPQTLAVTTLGLGLYWRIRGCGRFFDQPGHWLLIVVTIDLAFGIIGPLFFTLVAANAAPLGGVLSWLPFAAFLLLPRLANAITLLIAPQYVDQRQSWRRLFLTTGIVQLLAVVFAVVFTLGGIGFTGMLFTGGVLVTVFSGAISLALIWLLVAAVRTDHRLKAARHWSHWCGVATWGWVTALGVVVQIYGFFR